MAQRRWIGGLLWIALFVLLNANGREIGNFDTQPAKFAARELALNGTLTLDRIVAAQPLYGNRSAFVYARDGHWRNAYSPVPVLEAAAVGVTLATLHLLDLEAPGAPAILAKLTASLLDARTGAPELRAVSDAGVGETLTVLVLEFPVPGCRFEVPGSTENPRTANTN